MERIRCYGPVHLYGDQEFHPFYFSTSPFSVDSTFGGFRTGSGCELSRCDDQILKYTVRFVNSIFTGCQGDGPFDNFLIVTGTVLLTTFEMSQEVPADNLKVHGTVQDNRPYLIGEDGSFRG